MAATFGGGLTTRIGDIKAFEFAAGGGITNFSLVTSPAPDHGTYRIKGVGGSDKMLVGSHSETFTWLIARQSRHDGTLSSGDAFDVFTGSSNPGGDGLTTLIIERVYASASTYNYRVTTIDGFGTRTVRATGTTAYSTGTDYTLRLETKLTGGSNATLKLWINGTLEITVSVTASFLGQWFLAQTNCTSAKFALWTLPSVWGSNSESDRPGVGALDWCSTPDGNTSETDYGDQTNCAIATLGTYTNWDDWATDTANAANDATDFNCGPALNYQEKSTLTAPTITVQTSWGALGLYRQRANVSSKTMDNWSRWTYSGSTVEVQLLNIALTAWRCFRALHTSIPGGGSNLSQAIVDGSELGHRVVSTNGANAEVSTIAMIWFTIDSDAPTFDGLPSAILGSANAGVY